MTKQSHDHNFKNLFLDFPKETLTPKEILKWFFPQAEQNWGQVRKIEFVRQEPRKHNLPDPSLSLDMPILFFLTISNCFYGWLSFRKTKQNFQSIRVHSKIN